MAAFCPPEELPWRPQGSPAACSAPRHQGPCGASDGAQTGGSSASYNTTPRAPTHTPRHRRPSTARAPDTNSRRAQLKRLHHPTEISVWGCVKPGCRNRRRAGGNQSQSGRTAQPGCSRLPDLAPAPWQDTRHPARSEARHVGPIGSHQRRRSRCVHHRISIRSAIPCISWTSTR